MTQTLAGRIKDDQFAGYAYAYPHKTSYRPLSPPVALADAWQHEVKDAIYLYVHLPFCEMRCGFCNLFTTVQPKHDFVAATLDALLRQSQIVADQVQPEHISQVAFGGGTPSFLTIVELEKLLAGLDAAWPINWKTANSSFEVSPATITTEKLTMLRSRGIQRISMGVQSFSADDLKQLGRPQKNDTVFASIDLIQQAEFPVFNLDLIYGMQGQTMASWMQTVEQTIQISPEEIFLYPLYVRELTGLGRTGKSPISLRRQLFLAARDALSAAGYEQLSMRLFRKREVTVDSDYCCQEDGMVGLGPGARSYTQSLHYSSEFAVGQQGVKSIIGDFNRRSDVDFEHADYGVRLDEHEQRRRYLIKSLLRSSGLDAAAYSQRFGSQVEADFPQLIELAELNLSCSDSVRLWLNEEGLSWSDVIGPWLYSDEVVAQMKAFELV